MTNHYSTASTAISENTPYPTHSTNTVPLRIAEDEGTYSRTHPSLTPALKCLELKAQQQVLAGQITRLYGLVNLLLPNEQPTDRNADELRQLAIDLEQATEIIEATVKTLLVAIVEES